MRALIQRVTNARVSVDGQSVGAIGSGLLALVGVRRGDDRDDSEWIAGKLAGLRVFRDRDGKMNLSVVDAGGRVLLVPQFTLYGDVRRGRRPSFEKAARPEEAVPLLDDLQARLESAGLEVETGEFGAMMTVDLVNDGPVTLMLDSATRNVSRRDATSGSAEEVAPTADRLALLEESSRLAGVPIVLASASPRRRDLLNEIGLSFEVVPPNVDESTGLPDEPEAHALALAERKARAVAESREEGVVVAADTIVVVDGRVFGKPEDEDDALRMLKTLSGRAHLVHTAVSVLDVTPARLESRVTTTRVTFRAASEDELRRYIGSGEPMDRAGAYAIQGIGGLLVAGIEGDYTNVVGLPVGVTLDLLTSVVGARSAERTGEVR
jgi:MAF protein/D-tyrosyl-tRNA(Tyr) deacylase